MADTLQEYFTAGDNRFNTLSPKGREFYGLQNPETRDRDMDKRHSSMWIARRAFGDENRYKEVYDNFDTFAKEGFETTDPGQVYAGISQSYAQADGKRVTKKAQGIVGNAVDYASLPVEGLGRGTRVLAAGVEHTLGDTSQVVGDIMKRGSKSVAFDLEMTDDDRAELISLRGEIQGLTDQATSEQEHADLLSGKMSQASYEDINTMRSASLEESRSKLNAKVEDIVARSKEGIVGGSLNATAWAGEQVQDYGDHASKLGDLIIEIDEKYGDLEYIDDSVRESFAGKLTTTISESLPLTISFMTPATSALGASAMYEHVRMAEKEVVEARGEEFDPKKNYGSRTFLTAAQVIVERALGTERLARTVFEKLGKKTIGEITLRDIWKHGIIGGFKGGFEEAIEEPTQGTLEEVRNFFIDSGFDTTLEEFVKDRGVEALYGGLSGLFMGGVVAGKGRHDLRANIEHAVLAKDGTPFGFNEMTGGLRRVRSDKELLAMGESIDMGDTILKAANGDKAAYDAYADGVMETIPDSEVVAGDMRVSNQVVFTKDGKTYVYDRNAGSFEIDAEAKAGTIEGLKQHTEIEIAKLERDENIARGVPAGTYALPYVVDLPASSGGGQVTATVQAPQIEAVAGSFMVMTPAVEGEQQQSLGIFNTKTEAQEAAAAWQAEQIDNMDAVAKQMAGQVAGAAPELGFVYAGKAKTFGDLIREGQMTEAEAVKQILGSAGSTGKAEAEIRGNLDGYQIAGSSELKLDGTEAVDWIIQPLQGNTYDLSVEERAARMALLGKDANVFFNRMFTAVSSVSQGGSVYTVIEEGAEGFLKILSARDGVTDGSLSPAVRSMVMSWKQNFEDEVKQAKAAPGFEGYDNSDNGLIEWFSSRAIDYATGIYLNEDAEADRKLMPSGVRGFMETVRRLAKVIVSKANFMNRLRESGALPETQEQAMRKVLGLPNQFTAPDVQSLADAGFEIFDDQDVTITKTYQVTQTAEFNAWFGDSKVVDENGKPLVVYHGGDSMGFDVFDTDGKGKTAGTGAFFTSDWSMVKSYSSRQGTVSPKPSLEAVLADPAKYDYTVYYDEEYEVWIAQWQEGSEYKGDTEEEALEMAVDNESTEAESGIYDVYLSIKDPMVIDAMGQNWDDIAEGWDVINEDGDRFDTVYTEEEAEKMVADGKAESYERGYGRSTDEIAREAHDMGDGIDGVIIKNVVDPGESGYGDEMGDVYVAFKPEQIKSATGNRGTFDPADPRITHQVAEKSEQEDMGRHFQAFFSDVTTGKSDKYKPDLTKYEPVMPMTKPVIDFQKLRYQYRGSFDEHIMTSIPSFDEIQAVVGQAIVDTFPEGTRMLDIGASEGSTIKAISKRSDGRVTGIALDPNQDMRNTFHEKGDVDGVDYSLDAFVGSDAYGAELWTEPVVGGEGEIAIKGFDPKGEKFNVIHEAMVFQFIDSPRSEQIDAVVEMLAPDGMAIFEEKYTQDAETQAANETKKDVWKGRFYDQSQLSAKEKDVLKRKIDEGEKAATGMTNLQVKPADFEAILKARFEHVAQFWDSGNFRGYVATNDAAVMDKFLGNLQIQPHEFETQSMPRTLQVTQTAEFKQWFGDSKVVDENGEPLVMYHGTFTAFDRFAPNSRGVYFLSPDPEWVSDFVTEEETKFEDGINIIPAFVRAENPFDYENDEHVNRLAVAASFGDLTIDQVKGGDWVLLEDRSTLKAIKSLGFDGVYVEENGVKNLGVFDPTQIKSATGNRGTFDTTDPNITHQVTTATLNDFTKENVGNIANVSGWMILTAENPNGVDLPAAENEARNAALKADLEAQGLEFIQVEGRYEGLEKPFLVIGTDDSRDHAAELARQYDQESVLTREGLTYQDGSTDVATGNVAVHDAAPEDYYTTMPDGTMFTMELGENIPAELKEAPQEGDLGEDVDVNILDGDGTDIEWPTNQVVVKSSAFPTLDDELKAEIYAATDTLGTIHIDRMKAGGDFDGTPLQGGMFYSAIVENLENRVVWAFNSLNTANDVIERAKENGGYLGLTLMEEGNVSGNKTFATIWFGELKKAISEKRTSKTKALKALNAQRVKSSKLKTKIKFPDNHKRAWKTVDEAERAIIDMGQIARGVFYFSRGKADTAARGKHTTYGLLSSKKLSTELNMPTVESLVEQLEEPAFKGLPADSVVGVIYIDPSQKAMSAEDAGVTPHLSYGYVVKGRPVAKLAKAPVLTDHYPELKNRLMSAARFKMPVDMVANLAVTDEVFDKVNGDTKQVIKKEAAERESNEQREKIDAPYFDAERVAHQKALDQLDFALTERSFPSQVFAKYGMSMGTRLRNVNLKLFGKVRENRLGIHQRIARYQEATVAARELFKQLSKQERQVLGLHLSNGTDGTAEEAQALYAKVAGLEESIAEVRAMLDTVRHYALVNGFESNKMKNYWPRWLQDRDTFLINEFGIEIKGAIDAAIATLNREAMKKNVAVDEEDILKVVSNVIAGTGKADSKPSNLKERGIKELKQSWFDDYYAKPFEAVDRYINTIVEKVEKKKFFGKAAVLDETTGVRKLNLADSIAGLVGELVNKGELNPAEQEEVIAVLQAMHTKAPMHEFMQRVRSLGYISTMMKWEVAMVNFEDITSAIFTGRGVGNLRYLAGLFDTDEMSLTRDFGMDTIGVDHEDAKKSLSGFMNWGMEKSGVAFLGRGGANTQVNSGIRAYRASAQSGKFTDTQNRRLMEFFGGDMERVSQLKKDLAENVKTEDTVLLGWNILLDFQPMDYSEMPEGYAKAGNMRIFYMLKTFMLKRWDIFRREGIRNIRLGVAHRDKKLFLEGMRNMAWLYLLYLMGGATVDFFRDAVSGKEPKLEDVVFSNMLKVAGISRYTFYEAKRNGVPAAAFRWSMFPVPYVDYPMRDLANALGSPDSETRNMLFGRGDEDWSIGNADTWRVVPFIGGLYHWYLGGGESRQREDEAKEQRKRMRELGVKLP